MAFVNLSRNAKGRYLFLTNGSPRRGGMKDFVRNKLQATN